MRHITTYITAILALTCLTLNANNPLIQVTGNFDRSASNHYAYPFGTDVDLPTGCSRLLHRHDRNRESPPVCNYQ